MIHVEGLLGGKFVRSSTGTRTWQQALGMVRTATRLGVWEKKQIDPRPSDGKLLSEVVDEYLADCESEQGRYLARATIVKYRTVLNGLVKFCKERDVRTIDKVDFPLLQAYRRSWQTAAHASSNNIARLRTFWKFAVKQRYAAKNVALELEMPRGEAPVERMPFSDGQMERILKTARTMRLDPQQSITNDELEVFVMVQRYAGLALADAALLKKSELKGDEIRYYRKKLLRSPSRKLVIVPIPANVIERLKAIPLKAGKYYFCTGSDIIANVVEAWRCRLRKLFDAAGVSDGTSHRFRHTFAYDLLTQGISIQRVSKWLGHSSIKVTEKHYNHFLEGRIQADNDVLRELYAKRGDRLIEN